MSATDNNRKLVVGRLLVVGSVYRPAISGQINTPAARIDHRLDTDHQSLRESRAVTLTPIVRDAWSLVHLSSEPVAFQLTDNRETE